MIQTVRSIASEEWRRIHHEPVVLESSFFSAEFDGMPALSDVATTSISPEREAIARQTLQEIVEIFANDSVALAVLLGLAKGLTPDEVQSTSNLTATQYASAQKRIRRLLARRFPLGDIS
jgi:RNA polymerase sigma-70 factor (ECF subfamily)